MKASRSLSPLYFGTGVTVATVLIKVLGINEDGSRSMTQCMAFVTPCLILKWNSPYQSIPVMVPVGGRLGSQDTWCVKESCCQSKPEDVSHGLASVLGWLANHALGVLVGLLDEGDGWLSSPKPLASDLLSAGGSLSSSSSDNSS
jgi:hypothetical protein